MTDWKACLRARLPKLPANPPQGPWRWSRQAHSVPSCRRGSRTSATSTSFTAAATVALALLVPGAGSPQDARPFARLLVDVAGVEAGMTVADIGTGRGDFAFRLAQIVGPAGRVYANEISEDNLGLIERERRDRSVENLTVVRGEQTDPRLPGPVDRIMMIDVYHHLARPADFLVSLRKYLRPQGRLVIAAVVNRRNPQAKPSTSKTHDPCVSDPEETRKAVEQAGFVFETLVLHEDPARSWFWPTSYALVFRAPSEVPPQPPPERRAASERIGNIETVLREENDPRFPQTDLDTIVVSQAPRARQQSRALVRPPASAPKLICTSRPVSPPYPCSRFTPAPEWSRVPAATS